MYLIEEDIINAVKSLLTGRVNELLEELEYQIPLIEFGYGISPVIRLSTGERSEKERIIKSDVYSVVLVFAVPEKGFHGNLEEWNCYAYAAAVDLALGEDATMGGVVDRAVMTGKKYTPPKAAHCGGHWELELKLHILVEF
ncbi:hypothetical protein AGMMS50268_41420 [Spirochaetia bacterium]|nr:hypothetical protein AGMMS50268_41420 [Spirochaetia bacterium]